jgi:Rrf2 family protein
MIALAAEPDNRSQATAVLAEKLQIPLPFLHQIGRSLIQGRLIKATPGPHGGLRLNVAAQEISLLQIVETLEGPVCITPCLDGEACQRQDTCNTGSVWSGLQSTLINHLSAILLSELSAPLMPKELVEMLTIGQNGKSSSH